MSNESVLEEHHLEFREMAREFATKRLDGVGTKIDLADGRIPDEIMAEMGRLGFFGLTLPEAYGGLGQDLTSMCVVTEELAAAGLTFGSVIHRNSVCGELLARSGTEEQKQRFLPGLASGELQSSSSGTEPEAGSDAANIKTRAVRDGDHYVLNGSKQWTTNADRAGVLFTYVRTSDESKHHGISLLMVEKEPGEQFVPPTLTGTHLPTAGYHGMHSYSLYFSDHRVPVANLVGGVEGQGFRQLMKGYESARITFAFRCIGLARAAYESAKRHTAEREQFGQSLDRFQAVRFRLADMATQIEAARALGLMAARGFDSGRRVDLEAGMAKLFAAEMAHKVAWDALYLHGGAGYAIEADVNRHWRDSGLLPIGEGTSDIQREVIARRLLDAAR
ncbi:acyl-CoA dehydrogenase family protein [Actinoplanes bogorensis]|uniref:Acyl-CoA dehydrogenase family protein n=1 Tax=Paractinoplanes bogorensis TaxID=1610840 RepID=A0ABS5YV23_9ACTN|nr:acyl-CoA dehydrogenase family protein [Actinoplanes bogorensis]MBU2667186.1 acyl-CoA dehydrogenase family protein [Actinoplanes bogorensis]